MKSLPNLLLISGTGQNSGKTTLACKLIAECSIQFPITAIKISPHFHEPTPRLPEIAAYEGFVIYEEILHDTGKDSSRFLDAGAKRVYYITAQRDSQYNAMETLLEKIPAGTPIICEAGGLHHHFKPGLHIVTISKNKPPQKEIPQSADLVVEFDGEGFKFETNTLLWKDNEWNIIK
ncbi:MAG: hypothetical protein EA393_02305 [Bacteroidetes bacterium]|nr:MAG: hypothetical protein EA393_02305 [Bacteroidota bacterium]